MHRASTRINGNAIGRQCVRRVASVQESDKTPHAELIREKQERAAEPVKEKLGRAKGRQGGQGGGTGSRKDPGPD